MKLLRGIKPENLETTDRIIALMGPTGTGKSTFIDTATRQKVETAGHSLKSYTSDIRAVKFIRPSNGQAYVLVDTPGFNDTNKSDTEILKLIANWLETTYKKKVLLAGIIYLHRISDNRMAGSPLKNLHMFAKLCGDSAIGNVVLATTMWTKVKPEVAQRREEELKEKYWDGMLKLGSKTMRFQDSFDSAWEIIDKAIDKPPTHSHGLLLQEEMVDLERRLSETEAGKTLYNSLQKLLAEQKETIHKLREEAEAENNEQLTQELTAQYNDLQKSIQSTFDQMAIMKIPLSRRIRMIFSFRKARSRALMVDGK